MPKVSLERVINHSVDFFLAENKNREWRSLYSVNFEDLSQQLESLVGLKGLLLHDVEDVIEDGHSSGSLLVAELLLFAEIVVHVVKVQFKEINLRRRMRRTTV
jgi:hypothetical protein